jgi:nucleotide-binding universal stress UspA family protein
MFQLILVPWDASPLARRAVETAVELAVGYEAEVVATSIMTADGSTDGRDSQRAELEAAFDPLARAASDRKVPVSHVILEAADAARALIRHAHEHGADLVVIGHHRHDRPGSFVLHGVTEHLVEESTVPILVVTE